MQKRILMLWLLAIAGSYLLMRVWRSGIRSARGKSSISQDESMNGTLGMVVVVGRGGAGMVSHRADAACGKNSLRRLLNDRARRQKSQVVNDLSLAHWAQFLNVLNDERIVWRNNRCAPCWA